MTHGERPAFELPEELGSVSLEDITSQYDLRTTMIEAGDYDISLGAAFALKKTECPVDGVSEAEDIEWLTRKLHESGYLKPEHQVIFDSFQFVRDERKRAKLEDSPPKADGVADSHKESQRQTDQRIELTTVVEPTARVAVSHHEQPISSVRQTVDRGFDLTIMNELQHQSDTVGSNEIEPTGPGEISDIDQMSVFLSTASEPKTLNYENRGERVSVKARLATDTAPDLKIAITASAIEATAATAVVDEGENRYEESANETDIEFTELAHEFMAEYIKPETDFTDEIGRTVPMELPAPIESIADFEDAAASHIDKQMPRAVAEQATSLLLTDHEQTWLEADEETTIIVNDVRAAIEALPSEEQSEISELLADIQTEVAQFIQSETHLTTFPESEIMMERSREAIEILCERLLEKLELDPTSTMIQSLAERIITVQRYQFEDSLDIEKRGTHEVKFSKTTIQDTPMNGAWHGLHGLLGMLMLRHLPQAG